jgi:lysophospholipase L1-like esterase
MDRSWILAGLLLLGGYGLVRMTSQGVRLKPGDRLLLVGDSLAMGLAPHLQALSRDAGHPFQSVAQISTTIEHWSHDALLTSALEQLKPNYVLICLGTNDAYSSQPLETVKFKLKKLLDKVQAAGAVPLWITPPKLPPKARQDVLQLLDAATPNRFQSRDLALPQPDGIHSTPRGYAGWAGAIWAWLT